MSGAVAESKAFIASHRRKSLIAFGAAALCAATALTYITSTPGILINLPSLLTGAQPFRDLITAKLIVFAFAGVVVVGLIKYGQDNRSKAKAEAKRLQSAADDIAQEALRNDMRR